MKDFDALKDLWNGQMNGPNMDHEDILRDVRKSGSSIAGKLLTEALAMLAGILIFGWIWLEASFLLWTTHLSIAIMIACCLYYLIVQLTDYRRFSSEKHILQKPESYITYLQKYQRDRYNFNTRNYKIYSVFIGLAMALFAIELYYISPVWQSILGLMFTIGWFIMCWRWMITYRRKEQERLNEMITKLERIKKQFN
ncbi:hypothetical protein [Arcticibacter sp.]|jgi:Ca2+/Na+ antiporter|uniref:hypothetical protein n=1 Tax=Arcticibacter sp. TaxID=1872630 RepID=UPI00388FC709